MKRNRQKRTPANLPLPGEGKRGISGHIAYLLRQANAAVRQKMESALADLVVTQPQFSLMTILAAYGCLSGADLARLTLLTPQTVNLIVRHLERDGVLTRKPHPVHGRLLQLELTHRGLALLKTCKYRVAGIEAKMTAHLMASEEAIVRRWLVSLATN